MSNEVKQEFINTNTLFKQFIKKIKIKSNNPCACQDRKSKHILPLQCTYSFAVTELD